MVVAAALIGHDRDRAGFRYQPQLHELMPGYRLLAMLDVERRQRLKHFNRVQGSAPALVGIYAQRMIRADAFANGTDALHIGFFSFPQLYLDGGETLFP